MKDYYYILGILPSASAEEIKKAYRKLSQKFHPDKNDGDAFFADRFKEILEAYEVLSGPGSRQRYDQLRTQQSSGESQGEGTNFSPEIAFFRADKVSFEYGEEVTFSWKVLNADDVEIRPFGKVTPVGSKTYRIKNFKNPSVSFEIVARNTFIERECKKSLTLGNRTYEEQRRHFKQQIDREGERYKREQRAFDENQADFKSNDVRKEPNEGNDVLFIIASIITVILFGILAFVIWIE